MSSEKMERKDLADLLTEYVKVTGIRGKWTGDRRNRYYLWLGLQYHELRERVMSARYDNELLAIHDEMVTLGATYRASFCSAQPAALSDKFLLWEQEMLHAEATGDVADIRLFVAWTRDRCDPGQDFLGNGEWLYQFRKLTIEERNYVRRAYFPTDAELDTFTYNPCQCGSDLYRSGRHHEDLWRCGKCLTLTPIHQ